MVIELRLRKIGKSVGEVLPTEAMVGSADVPVGYNKKADGDVSVPMRDGLR